MCKIAFICSMIHNFLQQDAYLRTSLSPQFLSSQNSLFNIWPGSILQLHECDSHYVNTPN